MNGQSLKQVLNVSCNYCWRQTGYLNRAAAALDHCHLVYSISCITCYLFLCLNTCYWPDLPQTTPDLCLLLTPSCSWSTSLPTCYADLPHCSWLQSEPWLVFSLPSYTWSAYQLQIWLAWLYWWTICRLGSVPANQLVTVFCPAQCLLIVCLLPSQFLTDTNDSLPSLLFSHPLFGLLPGKHRRPIWITYGKICQALMPLHALVSPVTLPGALSQRCKRGHPHHIRLLHHSP